MVGLPVTLLCRLKFNLAVSPQLENEVTTLTSVRDKKVVQKVGNLRLFLYLCK